MRTINIAALLSTLLPLRITNLSTNFSTLWIFLTEKDDMLITTLPPNAITSWRSFFKMLYLIGAVAISCYDFPHKRFVVQIPHALLHFSFSLVPTLQFGLVKMNYPCRD